jgi:hypothetical protein
MKFCPVVPEICHGQVHGARKERRRIRIRIIIIIIRNGAKTISLPKFGRLNKYTYGHSSKSKDLTLDKCVPKFLWIPEHSIQIKVPKLRLAQSGSEKKRQNI